MSTKGPSIAPRSQALAASPPANSPPVSSKPIMTKRPSISSAPSPAKTSSATSSTNLAPSPNASGFPQIITSKEWVLPPRPKPGRKPSVDTPASKRKAQNRAAQRAFRERRATRVQELEEKLMEVEKDKELRELNLHNTINKLKVENQFLMKSMDQMRNDILSLKNSSNVNPGNNTNDHSRSPVNPQIQKVSPIHYPPTNSPAASSNSSYSVQQISPAPSADSPPIFNQNNQNDPNHHHHHIHTRNNLSTSTLTPSSNNTTPDKPIGQNKNHHDENDFDCGICLKDECLCASVGLKDTTNANLVGKSLEETINSFKPMPAVSLKSSSKKRKSNENIDQEIDFTKEFAVQKPMPNLKKLKRATDNDKNNSLLQSIPVKKENEEFNESSPVENCGFCSDDTPCVCREAAKEAARLNESLNTDSQHQSHHQHEQHQDEDEETSLPPIQLNNNSFRKTSLPVMHPGPSVEIREITNLTPGAVPTVVRRNTDGTTIPEDEENNDKEKETTGCTGNPGACLQCQTDPMSTLFCATVANKVKESENNPDSNDQAEAAEAAEAADSPASLSAASPARDFFNFNAKSNSTPPAISRSGSKTNIPSLAMTSLTNPSTPIATTPGGTVTSSGMFIPCADAYKTLSRHKKFNSVDFSTLVGKLTTRGMQVEVQSVANVLRELDRRLYN